MWRQGSRGDLLALSVCEWRGCVCLTHVGSQSSGRVRPWAASLCVWECVMVHGGVWGPRHCGACVRLWVCVCALMCGTRPYMWYMCLWSVPTWCV